MTRRIGIFLFLVGLTMIGLFLLSDVANDPAFNLLVAGVLVLAFGVFLLLRSPSNPPAPSQRFGGVRSFGKKKPPAKKK